MTPKDLRERARAVLDCLTWPYVAAGREELTDHIAAFAQEIGEEAVKHFEKTLTKKDRTGLAALFGFEAGERTYLDRAKKAEQRVRELEARDGMILGTCDSCEKNQIRVKVLEEALAEAVKALGGYAKADCWCHLLEDPGMTKCQRCHAIDTAYRIKQITEAAPKPYLKVIGRPPKLDESGTEAGK